MDNRVHSIAKGANTFTLDRLEAILQSERFSYDYRTNIKDRAYSDVIYGPLEMGCEINTSFFASEPVGEEGIRCFSNKDIKLRATKFCQEFYGHDTPVSISVARLDDMFSRIFRFKFEPLEDSQAMVKQASRLVERMPAWPLELDDVPTSIPPEYQASSLNGMIYRDLRLWEQLQATTYVSSTVLRVALATVIDPSCSRSLEEMINIIAALLEIVSRLVSATFDIGTSWRSFIARAFLWTSWQRCQLIYFYINADDALVMGSSDGKGETLALRGTCPSPGVTVHELSKQRASIQKPAYMCGWNFELLRTNSVCVGADFRRFHQLYGAAFGAYPARCFAEQSGSCKGNSTKSCQRFQGMSIKDQSAHDQSCPQICGQLIWDEMSYRNVSGARSVSLARSECNPSKTLQYCNASDQTLAISHVWSQ